MLDDVTKGSVLAITGEALRELLGLPKQARIMKIVPSGHADYVFQVVYFDRESYEIAEAQAWPIIKRYDLDDCGKIKETEMVGEKEK